MINPAECCYSLSILKKQINTFLVNVAANLLLTSFTVIIIHVHTVLYLIRGT